MHISYVRPSYIDNWNLILSNLKSQATQSKTAPTGEESISVLLSACNNHQTQRFEGGLEGDRESTIIIINLAKTRDYSPI